MGYLYELAVTPYVFAKKHFGGGSCEGMRGPEQRVSYGAQRQQRFSYWEPAGDGTAVAENGKPVVLYFHGGGFVFGESESMADAADVYVAKGYRFCSIGFREAPWGKFPAQVDDAFAGAKAAIFWLEARGVDCSRRSSARCVSWRSSGARSAGTRSPSAYSRTGNGSTCSSP